MNIHDIKAELEQEGYNPVISGNGVIREYLLSVGGTVQEAYDHLQKQRRYEAMQDYLMELERNLNKASREAQKQGYSETELLGVGIHFTADDMARLKKLLG